MNLRCVDDIRRKCCMNIALDEVFFTKEPFENILRFYRWTEPAYTIGYFQKIEEITNGSMDVLKYGNGNDKKIRYNIVRRLTGGLAVLHDKDLSYSLIVSDDIWKYIYDQEQTYKAIHQNIKKSLEKIDIFCDKTDIKTDNIKNFSCVKTLYKDDLLINGKKIVGSCQRRRGKKILVEGSIHLHLTEEEIRTFTQDFFNNFSKELNCGIIDKPLTEEEINTAENLCKEKYDNDKWNGLF